MAFSRTHSLLARAEQYLDLQESLAVLVPVDDARTR